MLEHGPADTGDIAKEVADCPAEGFVVVEGVFADGVADGSEDGEGDDEVEVAGVDPFSHRRLGGSEREVRLRYGL